MERLLSVFGQVGDTRVRSDDDFIDRLSHRYSTFILVVFAIIVSTKQYVGEPINCWCPAQFTDNHEDFANKICWVSNTYYVPISQKHIPEPEEPKERIQYYQWVPMILLTQALFFYLPCMVWRFFNNKAGVDVNNIVETAMSLQHLTMFETRDKTLRFTARHLDRYLGATREYRRGCLTSCKHFLSRKCCFFCGRKYGNYIMVLFLLVKTLYLVNVVSQLFILNAFLGTDYHWYGYEVLVKLAQKKDFTFSSRFPRITLCDFKIRQLANIHRHTVQCVLPINLFNEKIYIFVWFWLVFVALATIVGLLTWLTRYMLRSDQVRFVKNHLKALDKVQGKEDNKQIKSFVQQYLRQDGVLVLRLISINANQLVAAELIAELWSHFRTAAPLLSRASNRLTNAEAV